MSASVLRQKKKARPWEKGQIQGNESCVTQLWRLGCGSCVLTWITAFWLKLVLLCTLSLTVRWMNVARHSSKMPRRYQIFLNLFGKANDSGTSFSKIFFLCLLEDLLTRSREGTALDTNQICKYCYPITLYILQHNALWAPKKGFSQRISDHKQVSASYFLK